MAGCIAEALPAEEEERFRLNEDRFSVVLTVHSDTSGFDFLAQVIAKGEMPFQCVHDPYCETAPSTWT